MHSYIDKGVICVPGIGKAFTGMLGSGCAAVRVIPLSQAVGLLTLGIDLHITALPG